jgi:micrococcal nuclease
LTFPFPLATHCAVLLSFNLLAATKDIQARVIGVSDGDTITVLVDNRPTRVRLWGIDCPEASQPYGNRAKQFTSSLAFGKTVTLRILTTDRYRRPVALVILPDGSNLNHEIVRAGFRWWFRRYAPRDREFERLERLAREERAGLWRDTNPMPPWEFRATTRRVIR